MNKQSGGSSGGGGGSGGGPNPGDTPAAAAPSTKPKKKSSSSKDKPNPNAKAAKLDVISIGNDGYDDNIAPSLNQKVRIVPGKNEFQDRYAKGSELGLGAFSNVFLGTHLASQQEYAVKKIDREKMIWGDSRDALEDEVNHLILVS